MRVEALPKVQDGVVVLQVDVGIGILHLFALEHLHQAGANHDAHATVQPFRIHTYDAKVNKNVNIKGAEGIISVASGKGAESEKSDEPAAKSKTEKKDE